jgi:hypothetical protein
MSSKTSSRQSVEFRPMNVAPGVAAAAAAAAAAAKETLGITRLLRQLLEVCPEFWLLGFLPLRICLGTLC